MKIKIFLLVISSFLSILTVELLLRNYISKYQDEHYIKATSYRAPFYSQMFDDKYESYSVEQSNTKIICIGDSYTNGGNVLRSQTYPEQLFSLLGEKNDVLNMGLCEDNSPSSLKRLKHEVQDINKSFIVIYLGGASDNFMSYRFESKALDNYYKSLSLKDGENEGFLERFKIIKLVKYIYLKKEEQFRLAMAPKKFHFKSLEKCFQKELNEICIANYLNKNHEKLLEKRSNFNVFITQVIYLSQTYEENKYSYILNILKKTIEKEPRLLAFPEAVYNIIAFTSLQQKESSAEIYEFIKKQFERERKYISSSNEDSNDPDKFENVLVGLEIWVNKEHEISKNRKNNIAEMVKLVREKGGEIILMTYPISYKIVNEDIKNVAKDLNVRLIDLDQIFKDEEAKGVHLISDWEHCTPAGYRLIAQKINSEIQDLLNGNK